MEPFLGEIRALGSPILPMNWAYCDGSLLLIKENEALYELIGTSYGGDGVTHFALPDLQSRIPMGHSLRNPVGHKGGSEQADLTVENLPVHRHVPACSTDDQPDSKGATDAFWSGAAEGGLRYAPAPGSVSMHAESIQQEGDGKPHENRMPVLAVNYIIALHGIYPTHG